MDNKYKMNLLGESKSIILATDGSEYSYSAIKEGLALAGACNTALTVLKVLEYNPELATVDLKYIEEMERAAEDHFSKIREMGAEVNTECNTILRRSLYPYEAIIDEAYRLKADMIIMGKHGRTGLSKLFMGSTTAKVIALAPCKILIVPKESEITGEHLLLATDGSKFSKEAEHEIISAGKRCPVVKSLTAISVASSQSGLYNAEEVLKRVKINAEKEELKMETIAAVGSPYEEIIRTAGMMKVSLIMMGTHGRTGLTKFLMGSVAERVVALSQCPVMIVKSILP